MTRLLLPSMTEYLVSDLPSYQNNDKTSQNRYGNYFQKMGNRQCSFEMSEGKVV